MHTKIPSINRIKRGEGGVREEKLTATSFIPSVSCATTMPNSSPMLKEATR